MSLEPKDWIALIIKQAPMLREVGVTSLAIGDVAIELAPYEAPPARTALPDDKPPIDVMDDPALYGRAEGVPGFTRPKKRQGASE